MGLVLLPLEMKNMNTECYEHIDFTRNLEHHDKMMINCFETKYTIQGFKIDTD